MQRTRFILLNILLTISLISSTCAHAIPKKLVTAPTHNIKTPRSTTAHIIFDLGGVLVETNKKALFWQLGPEKIALSWLTTGKSPHLLKQTLYTTMNNTEQHHSTIIRSYDDEGLCLPSLMHKWLSGKQTNKEILAKLTDAIERNPKWFVNYAEQLLVQQLIETLFTPQQFIATRTFNQKGIELVQWCKDQGFKVYILSNWDAESFEVLKKEYADIFALFDGTIISGNYGCLKPDPQLYRILLQTFNLHPHDCVMIDDRPENILAARSLEIHGIHYAPHNNTSGSFHDFDSIAKEIRSWARYIARQQGSVLNYR